MTKEVFIEGAPSIQIDYEEARTNMLKQQIRTWDISNPKVLDLFGRIPRENFVPAKYKALAFADIAIPLPNNQSIMPPKEEAKILEETNIQESDKVLILGTDSGYLATLISHLAASVFYVDNELDSLERVKAFIKEQNLHNVSFVPGDIHQGWQEFIPYDVIILTGSLPTIPTELETSLNINGRLFVVVGRLPVMEATLITRILENTWNHKKLFETIRPRMLDVIEPVSFKF